MGGLFGGATAVWLASFIGPLVKRALMALGIGVVSYAGMAVAYGMLRDLVVNSWGQIPAGALAIASISGTTEGIGIILGAMAARLAMQQLTMLARIA